MNFSLIFFICGVLVDLQVSQLRRNVMSVTEKNGADHLQVFFSSHSCCYVVCISTSADDVFNVTLYRQSNVQCWNSPRSDCKLGYSPIDFLTLPQPLPILMLFVYYIAASGNDHHLFGHSS